MMPFSVKGGPGDAGREKGDGGLVCVVHLVWVPLGIEPLRNFLKSYDTHRAGMEHDLLIVMNGHRSEGELATFQDLLRPYRCTVFALRKPGLDITSYFAVVRKYRHHYFCFLNSYSRLLAQGWLKMLYTPVASRGVGLVGATGSCESLYTNFVKGMEPIAGSNRFRRVVMRWKQTIKLLKKKHRFDPFPNYHIRTNGFMIPREVMLKIHAGMIRRKTHAYLFESGKNSLTKQVMRMGLRVLVVDRAGRRYEREDWHRAEVFRQGRQSGLLIADNQTDAYEASDAAAKRELTARTWGDKAKIDCSEGVSEYDR